MSPDAEEPRAAAVSDSGGTAAPVPAAAQPALGILWWIAGLTVVIDQATKLLVSSTLPVYSSRTIIPNFIDLVHVHNAGVAFGLLNSLEDPRRGILSTGLALVALIIGGAGGNLIDRVRVGYVVDFVDVYWRNWHFWAFNVADSAITIGVAVMILDMLRADPHVPKTA